MRFILSLVLLSSFIFCQAQNRQIKRLKMDPKKPQVICKHHGAINPGHVILPKAQPRNKPKNPLIFNVDFPDNMPVAAIQAFEFALSLLSNQLSSAVPINVDVEWSDELEDGVLGAASTSEFVADFPNSNERTFYPIALAEKIVGEPINSDTRPDIDVFFNSEVNWYYDFNNPSTIPATHFDFVSVILHEMIHGLGFVGFSGLLNDGVTSRIRRGGIPSIYDVYLENNAGVNILDNFADPSAELTDIFQSNNVFLRSPAYPEGTVAPKVYTPSEYEPGSSIRHLDLATFRNSSNSLMTPQIERAAVKHDAGIAIDILHDLGWGTTHLLHDQKIGEENFSQDYVVNAEVVSEIGYNPNTLFLHYSQDSFQTVTTLPMEGSSIPNEFTATIPAPNEQTRFQYYFTLVDDRNIELQFPANAPNPLFYISFYEPDDFFPVMDHDAVVNIDDKTTLIPVDAIVTDFYSGIDSIYIEYYVNGVLRSTTNRFIRDFTDEFRDNLFVGAIELEEPLAATDKLEYRIIAVDKSVNKNETILPATGLYEINISETFDFSASYFNDFNTRSSDFSGNGFATGQPTGFTDVAIQSDHPYTNAGQERTLNFTYQLNIPILIQDRDPLIEFDEIVLVEPGESGTTYTELEFWDYVIVEGRRLDGTEWFPFLDGYDSRAVGKWFAAYNSNIVGQNSRAVGSPELFNPRVINMTQNGNFKAGEIVFIRFRLFSDPFAFGWGWAIDNLRIQDTQVAIEDFINSNDLALFPNPVSTSALSIKANFKQPVENLQIQVYDNNGRLVQSEQFENVQKDLVERVDISEQPDGIYLVVLRINDTDLISRKVMKN